ncbi:hypothetical protein CISG_03472 [Coccidioides immitis RMSCC 3703]|uniref:Uncharacterized protein n=1 Tax=Coccidioides immitis RMSCC 3703 TaxID=454286 RepID=A0A0J8THP7_COCIT|nr:hypothetical protein CISG_03472 [Coccidioides immitis RMSCC 3703]
MSNLVESLASTLWLARFNASLAQLLLGEGSSIWVESEHDLLVLERVLLLDAGSLGSGFTLWFSKCGLDFGGVDEAGNVGVGDDVGWEKVVFLEGGWGGGGAVNLVQSSEGRGGPDNEATEERCGMP